MDTDGRAVWTIFPHTPGWGGHAGGPPGGGPPGWDPEL